MATIQPVSYADLMAAPNFAELIAEYSAECSLPEIGPTNPQPQLYAAMENAGGLRCFGVYASGALIGLISLLIYVLPHYGRKIATTESFFLSRAHRQSSRGRQMLDFTENYAKSEGCCVLLITAPSGSKFERWLTLQTKKYRRTNSVFLRSFD